MTQETRPIYDFGSFRFLPDEKLLLRDGQPVPLPPKAIDTLAVLLERHGHVVLKDDLMQRVWPDTFVEEGNLTQQVSLLRKAFSGVDEGVIQIETLPRRGYRLIGPVTRGAGDDLLVVRERTRTQVVVEEQRSPVLVSAALRSWRWPVAALIGALALGGGAAFSWFTASRPVLSFERRDWVLILDFENTTGDARFGRPLVSALGVGLEQSQYFNVYSRSRVGGALQRMGKPPDTVISEEIAIAIAARDGIRALVGGSIARVGSGFLLTARLIDPKRMAAANAYSERAADEDGLLDALDALTRRLRRDLGESRVSISQASRPLPQITTASFAALQAFAEGSEAWNRGRLKDGVASWERAVALDPGFALAHAELGAAFSNQVLTDPTRADAHFKTALSLTERVTERERGIIEARSLFARGRHDELLSIYDGYLKTYPDDPTVNLNRGLTLMRLKRCPEAIAGFHEVLRVSPSSAAALLNIATCHNAEGRDREAVDYYERSFAIEPAWLKVPNLNHEYGFAFVGAGELTRAADVFRTAASVPETSASALRSLALLDMYQGKYRAAENTLRHSPLPASPGLDLRRARNQLFLAIISEGQGRPEHQIRDLDAAREALGPIQPQSAFWAARLAAAYARAGDAIKAAALVEGARPHIDQKNQDAWSELQRAVGELAVAHGEFAPAIAAMQTADRVRSTALTQESLAHALWRAGRTAEAMAAFETFLASPDWVGWEPQQRWFEAHIVLARLRLAHGERAKAAALLDHLLTRWRDADSNLPIVVDAQHLQRSIAHSDGARGR